MSRTRPSARARYNRVRTARGEVIDKDMSAHDALLFVHGESASGRAVAVSLTADWGDVRYLPKALVTIDTNDPCGGVERVDLNRLPLVIPIYEVSAPGFLFDEKGLR